MNKKNFKNLILNQNDSLQEAINVLEASPIKLILALDNQTLTGVLTDGDIRRALIKGSSLDSKIQEAMNQNFISVPETITYEKAKELIVEQNIVAIPVLSNGRIEKLITLDDVNKKSFVNNPVLLMAGGFGSRLSPLTDNCPKPLLKIGKIPILELIIKNFIKEGFNKFYVSTHYKAEMIKGFLGDGSSYGITVQYIDELEPLGTAGCLSLLPSNDIELPFIMMNADILTKVNFLNLLEHHNKSQSMATMCIRSHVHQIPYGVINFDDDNKLRNIQEKPSYNHFVSSGIYVLNPSVLNFIKREVRLDMPDLLNLIAQSNDMTVNLFPLHEYWLDIGQMNDFNKAQFDFAVDYND